jgi:hypothetical protein
MRRVLKVFLAGTKLNESKGQEIKTCESLQHLIRLITGLHRPFKKGVYPPPFFCRINSITLNETNRGILNNFFSSI